MVALDDNVGTSHANGQTTGQPQEPPVSKVDVLIVGAGPAGASLACFLSSYGITGVIISRSAGTADTPRAHITNMAAMECLRDIGLDAEAEQLATHGSCMQHTRWCHSMAGEEYARVHSWGNDPKRLGDYASASPSEPCDLPQTLLEPILVQYAIRKGYQVRFNTCFTSFAKEKDGSVMSTVKDDLSGLSYQIHSKYLFGADGARSRIAKQLDLPFDIKAGGGLAINVLVKADLSHLVQHRMGNLHWILQPENDNPDYAWMGIVRMVKPWHEWMFILLPEPGYDESRKPTKENYLIRVREFIRDDTPAEILSVSNWYINETVALRYHEGNNIFCLGDAVHRHPPFNGLGSNTCIQDAFNLAWKIAYTEQKRAGPALLSSYNAERQPVGYGIVNRANTSFRDHLKIWENLGNMPVEKEERVKIFRELSEVSENGIARRQAFQKAILHTAHEFHALGIEMGQLYNESSAVYQADEAAAFVPSGPAAEDPVLYYHASTYPGKRLPHAWLNHSIPSKPVSTIDLAGHGHFVILTGLGGSAWKEAALLTGTALGIPIKAYSIGFRGDFEDMYFDWERLRDVTETGAILVRPDRFVAWRSQSVLTSVSECADMLKKVLEGVLDLHA